MINEWSKCYLEDHAILYCASYWIQTSGKLTWHDSPTFEIIKEDFAACIYCRLHQGSKYQWRANSYNIQPRFFCISKGLTFCQSFGKVIPILQDNGRPVRQARAGSLWCPNTIPAIVSVVSTTTLCDIARPSNC